MPLTIQLTHFDDHFEITLEGLSLAKPRMYAYQSHEAVGDFLRQVSIDTGATSVELQSSTGASVSAAMAHSFAWRPGRTLVVDGEATPVQFDSAEDASGIGGRRASVVAGLGRAVTMQTKFVVVTGGVVSGLGKGVTASSIGVLMRCAGFRVTSIKIDPYLNVDAGTMSPIEHGEVFTLDDGGEVRRPVPPHSFLHACQLPAQPRSAQRRPEIPAHSDAG